MQIENSEGGEPDIYKSVDTESDEQQRQRALEDVRKRIDDNGDELVIGVVKSIDRFVDEWEGLHNPDFVRLIALGSLSRVADFMAESGDKPNSTIQTFNLLGNASISKRRLGEKQLTIDENAYMYYAAADGLLKKAILPAHPEEGSVQEKTNETTGTSTKRSNTIFGNLDCIEERDAEQRLLSTRFVITRRR